jgi:hypothetical protein
MDWHAGRAEEGKATKEGGCALEAAAEQQGAIVTFNLLRPNGEYVGYTEVEKLAVIHHIQLRTGCFCNPGACSGYLNLTPELIKTARDAGHGEFLRLREFLRLPLVTVLCIVRVSFYV